MYKNQEKRSHWNEVHGKEKIRYLFDYYKFPLFLAAAAVYIVVWNVNRFATMPDYRLYVGLVNVAPSEELTGELEQGFFSEDEPETGSSICLYRNLFLTSDEASDAHQYAYATRLKILGAIDAEQLDLVLMDKEAFDAFSQNGYLADLQQLLYDENNPAPGQPAFAFSPNEDLSSDSFPIAAAASSIQKTKSVPLYEKLLPDLVRNIYIEEDNSVDVLLGNAEEYHAVTTEGMFGLDLSQSSPLIRDAGLSGTVYLGILENSPRKEEALRYLSGLTCVP